MAGVVLPALALLVLVAAWIDGGRTPLRDIVEPVAVPGAPAAGGAK